MLPQTNLQLYRLMIQGGFDVESLARVRAAYDVATAFAALFDRVTNRFSATSSVSEARPIGGVII
jgi:hypothetical protein